MQAGLLDVANAGASQTSGDEKQSSRAGRKRKRVTQAVLVTSAITLLAIVAITAALNLYNERSSTRKRKWADVSG